LNNLEIEDSDLFNEYFFDNVALEMLTCSAIMCGHLNPKSKVGQSHTIAFSSIVFICSRLLELLAHPSAEKMTEKTRTDFGNKMVVQMAPIFNLTRECHKFNRKLKFSFIC
jgi:hypothetical protein